MSSNLHSIVKDKLLLTSFTFSTQQVAGGPFLAREGLPRLPSLSSPPPPNPLNPSFRSFSQINMAPRGLSAEEKRVKLVEIFHETRDFYQQSVKEVLQNLVDDNLVQSDKIGSSNLLKEQLSHIFWSSKVKNDLSAAQEEIISLETKITALLNEIENETSVRLDNPTRQTSLTLLQAKRGELAASRAELAQHGLADPAVLEQKRRAVVLAREAALRHTDNYSALFYQLVQLGCDAAELRSHLGVLEEYEDLE
ncbi:hypothetical protein FRC09_008255 [Ceratobasidium sp. 395]|nr:hypothetical protein FRC09_008255 [Ceratobasidium sp. 395]